jgi:hypothetical protein
VFIVLCGVLACAVIDVNTRLAETFTKLDTEIDEAHRATLEVGLTAMEARKASAKESGYLDQWNAQISKTFSTVNTAVTSLSSVSAATVSTLQETQATVHSLQAPINSANQALTVAQGAISTADGDLAALRTFIAHSDALVTDPAVTSLMSHVAGTASHVDAITLDFQKVADKATADYLKPVPWYQWPIKRGGELMDLGAAVARHTP